MLERLTAKSPFAVVVKSALEEARLRGDRRVGTEHLFLGLLHDPSSAPAQALGVSLDAARAALQALDRAALAAIGINIGQPQSPALSRKRRPPSISALTSAARTALDDAVKATSIKTRHLAPTYLLLALLECQPPDPAAELMTKLGIGRSAVRSHTNKTFQDQTLPKG